MKKIIPIIMVIALLAGVLGGIVYAQESTTVNAHFGIGYNYGVEGDSFTNGEVTGQIGWGTHFKNNKESPANDVQLTLDTGLTFEWIGPEPDDTGPPIYWYFGTIYPDMGVNAEVGPGSDVPFTPGFDVTRSADETHFTSPSIQTLTISVTPQQALPNLGIDVNVRWDENVHSVITSATMDPAVGDIWISPDGQNLHIQIEEPTEPTYECEVLIEVEPQVAEVEFMPDVNIGWGENTGSGSESGTSSLDHTITDLGIWTWSTAGSPDWQWDESLHRGVHLQGYSIIPVVNANFVTALSYGVSGDEYYDDSPVEGEKSWHSQLYTQETSAPVPDVMLSLESALEFDWIEPKEDSLGPPIQWSYGELGPGGQVGANVGHEPSGPFRVGVNATRSVDPIHFYGEGTHPQNVNITVTPQRPMPSLGVGIGSHDDDNIRAIIVGIDAPEADHIWEHPEGHGAEIRFENPVVGHTYTCQITLDVELKVDQEFEFKPDIQITWHQNVASGETSGSSLSYGLPQLGTWNWSIGDSRVWRWNQHIRRNLGFQGYARPLVNQVAVLFQNLWTYLSLDDNFVDTGTLVGGLQYWLTNILNAPDNTGEPVVDTILELDTFTTFPQVTPNPIPDPTPPPYRWGYGDIAEGESNGASVSFPGDDIDFVPGLSATRTFDKTVFSEPGTQTVTIRVTPQEEVMMIFIEAFCFPSPEVIPEIISYTGADLVFTHPMGRHLLMIKQAPASGEEFEVTVTYYITPQVAQVEYKPIIRVSNPVFDYMSSTTGPSASYEVVDTTEPAWNGTWTWSGDGNYEWIILGGIRKAVTFSHQFHTWIEEFRITHMSVDFDDQPGQDKVVAEGNIWLGEAASYDFSVDDVVINVDGVEIFVPAGSLEKKSGKECYQFKSSSGDNPQIELELDFENGEWGLKVKDIDASSIDNSDGVVVVMNIGDLSALELIDMQVGGLTYIADQ